MGSPAASPDGRLVAVTVTSYDVDGNEGRGRVWLLNVEGGEPRPITSAEASSGSPCFSPDGRRLAFTRKNDVLGKAQVHVMPLDGGEPERVTDLPLGAFDPRWLPDGSGIVFGAHLLQGHLTPQATREELERREKDPVKAYVTEDRFYRYWDSWLKTAGVVHLFAIDLARGTVADLTPESTAWFDKLDLEGQYDISPDGRELCWSAIVFDGARSLLRSAIFAVPLDGAAPAGPVRCLTPDHPADDTRPRYTPDGKVLIYGMQHDPFFYADRVRMMGYERAAGRHVELLGDWDRSPSAWEIAPDGTILITAEDHARVSLHGWKGVGEPWTIVPGGSVGVAEPAGSRLFVTMETFQQPPEVYGCRLDGRGLTRLTRFTEPVMSRVHLSEVREYHVKGASDETVQMWVLMPPGYEEGRHYPLLQVIHGGPHGISGDGFHFRWNAQLFAAPGYVAAHVNFQGSTSWGQDFAQRILGAWADRPFEDVMRATDLLVAEGIADPDRLAAAGGSYGGYLVSWIAGHTDRFKCLVNHAGVFDTLVEYACDVTQGRARAFGGEPWSGLESIDRQNPVRYASGFKTPMLIVHGGKDYRVPADQGLECYGILKAKGIPARLLYFPEENHWVLKPQSSLLWYREVMVWLERYLTM